MVGLGDFPGGLQESVAYGVSPDGGTAVGYSSSADGWLTYYWNETEGMVSIGRMPESLSSPAQDASTGGKIIVGTGIFANNRKRAYRWTKETGMVDMGALTGTSVGSSIAAGLSADGSVIAGQAWNGTYGQAFRWTAETGMLGLETYSDAGFHESQANAISDNGDWTVGFSRRGAGSLKHPVLWDAAGRVRDLAQSYTTGCTAFDVTDDGDTVLLGRIGTGENYLWTPETGSVPFIDIVRRYGPDLWEAGYNFSGGVNAMSPDGKWWIISSLYPGGEYGGAILMYMPIPAPGTILLLTAAGALITPRRQRA